MGVRTSWRTSASLSPKLKSPPSPLRSALFSSLPPTARILSCPSPNRSARRLTTDMPKTPTITSPPLMLLNQLFLHIPKLLLLLKSKNELQKKKISPSISNDLVFSSVLVAVTFCAGRNHYFITIYFILLFYHRAKYDNK